MRTISALLIIGLILSTACFASVDAQDYYELYKPTISGPNINVTSPQNNSIIDANSLQLIFNVTEPQIVKLSPNLSPNIIESNDVRNSSDVVSVYYKGDWQTTHAIIYPNQDTDMAILEFDEIISNVPSGHHQLEITATGTVGLIVAMFGFTYQVNSTSLVIFTVNSSDSNNQNNNGYSPFVEAPSLSIIYPDNFTYSGNWSQAVPLMIYANVLSDAPAVESISYSVDYGENVTLTNLLRTGEFPSQNGKAVAFHTNMLYLYDLTDGSHTLRAYSTDINGTVMDSEVKFFVLRETSGEKNIFPVSILLSVFLVIVVLSLFLFRRHRKTPKTN